MDTVWNQSIRPRGLGGEALFHLKTVDSMADCCDCQYRPQDKRSQAHAATIDFVTTFVSRPVLNEVCVDISQFSWSDCSPPEGVLVGRLPRGGGRGTAADDHKLQYSAYAAGTTIVLPLSVPWQHLHISAWFATDHPTNGAMLWASKAILFMSEVTFISSLLTGHCWSLVCYTVITLTWTMLIYYLLPSVVIGVSCNWSKTLDNSYDMMLCPLLVVHITWLPLFVLPYSF